MGKSAVGRSPHSGDGSPEPPYRAIIIANIGLLAIGFMVALLMDYGYITSGGAQNPDSFFSRTQWLPLLFPICVFFSNWRLLRGLSSSARLSVGLVLAICLSVIEIVLLFTIGTRFHFAVGGRI
jgi:hypothetical protein